MNETRYMISEASKRIDIEQHTLRYWEEELDLHIRRNEMGHRYYTEEDIEVLKAVKILKEKGYQLRAIKMLLPDIQKLSNLGKEEIDKMQQEWDKKYMEDIVQESTQAALSVQSKSLSEKTEEYDPKNTGKLSQFKNLMSNLISEAMQENNEVLADSISELVTKSVTKEIEYLLRMKEEREEERFKQFDRALRELQNSRMEAATSRSDRFKRKKGIFGKGKL